MGQETIISVRDLYKKFKNIQAVDGISFDVQKNETFGFLGPNGAGKTTTINIICTLMRQDRGTVLLNGLDTLKYKNKVRGQIGLVFQDPSLDDKLTAMENLHFHAMLYHVPSAQRKKKIDEVLEMVGLHQRRRDLVSTFSGGMKRRLEIARGLIHMPAVLFLDEPTIGLDPQTRNRIWHHIHELKKAKDITIFMTTHYMEETENCGRIAIMDQGKIIATDSPEGLKKTMGMEFITVSSSDKAGLRSYIEKKTGKPPEETQEGALQFAVSSSTGFIPSFIKDSPIEITGISARKPTLDDVFLDLTGREIREEKADGKARLKAAVMMRSRR